MANASSAVSVILAGIYQLDSIAAILEERRNSIIFNALGCEYPSIHKVARTLLSLFRLARRRKARSQQGPRIPSRGSSLFGATAADTDEKPGARHPYERSSQDLTNRQ